MNETLRTIHSLRTTRAGDFSDKDIGHDDLPSSNLASAHNASARQSYPIIPNIAPSLPWSQVKDSKIGMGASFMVERKSKKVVQRGEVEVQSSGKPLSTVGGIGLVRKRRSSAGGEGPSGAAQGETDGQVSETAVSIHCWQASKGRKPILCLPQDWPWKGEHLRAEERLAAMEFA